MFVVFCFKFISYGDTQTSSDITLGRVCHGRDRMVVRFTTTYAISAYHHYPCEFEFRSCRGVLDTTVCDKVCQ